MVGCACRLAVSSGYAGLKNEGIYTTKSTVLDTDGMSSDENLWALFAIPGSTYESYEVGAYPVVSLGWCSDMSYEPPVFAADETDPAVSNGV